jgi:hypothetical protein
MLLRHPKTVCCDDASEVVGVTCCKRSIEFTPLMAMDSNAGLELLGNVLVHVGGDSFEDRWSRVICDCNL